jgi:chromosomal replication initiation ATPase DnaA
MEAFVQPQLILPLAWKPLFEDHLFFVGDSNRCAFEAIQQNPFPYSCACLWGPSGSGKTHLGVLWSKNQQAVWIQTVPQSIKKGQAYLWDMSFPCSEEELWFFYQELHQQGACCLFLSQQPPSRWPIVRQDLLSRLKTMPCFEIQLPDDDVLKHVLQKCLADHGMLLSEGLLMYALQRMSRSFQAAQDLTDRLHKASLQEKKPVTLALLKSALL